MKEFETLAASKQLKHLSETRSAKALSKRIDKLVGDLDQIVNTLDKKQDSLKKDIKVCCIVESSNFVLKKKTNSVLVERR